MLINKNCLFISYDGLSDPLGQSQILPYILSLSKNSKKIHIISFEKNGWDDGLHKINMKIDLNP